MRKSILLFLAISFIFLLSCDDTVEPEDNNLPLVATYSVTHVSEYGASDGSIIITITTGTEPYQFKLNDGEFQSESSFTGLPADTYYITVTDGTSDIVVLDNIIIEEPSPTNMTIDVEVTDVTTYNGNDGSVTFDVNGGVPPYLYKLNDGEFVTDNTFTDLTSGPYSMTVKDNVDSTKIKDFIISEPGYTTMTLDIDTVQPSAYLSTDGSITINVTDGIEPYEYKMGDGEFQTTNSYMDLGSGEYIITVKDAVDSIKIAEINFMEKPYIPVDFTLTKTDVTINGLSDGSISVTNVTGGYGDITYSNGIDIDNPTWVTTTTFSGLIAGEYEIYVKDQVGIVSKGITITEPSELLTGSATETGMGEITVSASGGTSPYTYSINDGSYQSSNVFSSLSEGTYTIKIKDTNGVVYTVTSSITFTGLSIGDEHLGGIVYELSGTFPNQTGKIVYTNISGNINFSNANLYCNNLVVGSNDNWVLPTESELIDILTKYMNGLIDNITTDIVYWSQSSCDNDSYNTAKYSSGDDMVYHVGNWSMAYCEHVNNTNHTLPISTF